MKVLSILSTPCEICGVDEVAMEEAFPSVSSIYLSQSLLHQSFFLYLDSVVCNNPYQVAHYYILGIQVVGLISNLTHGWLQNSEVFILHTTHTKDHDRHNMSMCLMFTGYQG